MHASITSTYSPLSVARIATRSPLRTPRRPNASASWLTRRLTSANVRLDPSSKTKQSRSGKRWALSRRKSPAWMVSSRTDAHLVITMRVTCRSSQQIKTNGCDVDIGVGKRLGRFHDARPRRCGTLPLDRGARGVPRGGAQADRDPRAAGLRARPRIAGSGRTRAVANLDYRARPARPGYPRGTRRCRVLPAGTGDRG